MNRAAAAIFLALLCTGCPKRLEFGPEGQIEDPGILLRLVTEAQDDVLTLTGDAKLRVESPQGSGSLSMYLALSRPGLLRFELFDFFNRPVAALTADQARFGYYQVEGNTFYEGPASAQNLARFLPVALPSEELVAVLLGQVPFIPPERMTLELDREEALYVLTLYRGPVTQQLHVHPRLYRVVRSLVRGVPAYDLAYDDFEEKGGLVVPQEVVMRVEHASTLMRVRYTDITVNAAPDLTLFERVPPEGAQVVPVDEGGQQVPPLPLVPEPAPGS